MTNKPEVVAEVYQHLNNLIVDWKSPASESVCVAGDQLIRLSDYEALQAECEKLRSLLRHAQPIIRAHSGASHMLDGFRPKRNQWDELVEGIDAAIQEESRGR